MRRRFAHDPVQTAAARIRMSAQEGAGMSRREVLGSAAGLAVATGLPAAVDADAEKLGKGEVKAFIACSLDGFIAGPNGEIDWLPGPDDGVEDTFSPFMKTVGAMLMGRKSFDVVNAMGPEMWAYGDIPFLVATSHSLHPPRPSVRAVMGEITESVDAARSAADGRVVYVDGGSLIRSSLDAGLIDEIIVTLVPKVLGTGIPLFAGVSKMHELELKSSKAIGGGLVQLTYRTRK